MQVPIIETMLNMKFNYWSIPNNNNNNYSEVPFFSAEKSTFNNLNTFGFCNSVRF